MPSIKGPIKINKQGMDKNMIEHLKKESVNLPFSAEGWDSSKRPFNLGKSGLNSKNKNSSQPIPKQTKSKKTKKKKN